jgi:murein DD-endopeptidase MepM/ murein hydrolase activator NlpD
MTMTVTESSEGVKGDSANNVYKPATMETGLVGARCRFFINVGEKINVKDRGQLLRSAAPDLEEQVVEPAFAGKTHTIRAGDTFSGISKKYGISIASLAAANPNAKTTALRPGQILRLSSGARVSSPASAPATQARSAPQIASASGPSTGISSPSPAAGPALAKSLPPSTTTTVSTAPAAAPAAATAATHPSPEQNLSPTNPEKKIRSVTIEGEMTYGEFAATHGTDTARLNDLNGLDLTHATVLAKGSELYVPAQP